MRLPEGIEESKSLGFLIYCQSTLNVITVNFLKSYQLSPHTHCPRAGNHLYLAVIQIVLTFRLKHKF